MQHTTQPKQAANTGQQKDRRVLLQLHTCEGNSGMSGAAYTAVHQQVTARRATRVSTSVVSQLTPQGHHPSRFVKGQQGKSHSMQHHPLSGHTTTQWPTSRRHNHRAHNIV
jgi:hypothetical protein